MGGLHPYLGEDDVLTLLNQMTGFLSQGTSVETSARGRNDRTYLVHEAGLVVKIRPRVEPPHRRPAHVRALFGDVLDGGVCSLARVTGVLQRCGGLPVSSILQYGEGTGPGGSDYAIGEILPGLPFGAQENRMGHQACRQLGDHLGRLHNATTQPEGFGVLGGERIRWTRWWTQFAASYTVLANDVCDGSPALHGFRARLDGPLARAVRSPDPRAFPLVCVDQSPSRYLGGDEGRITGFVDVEGHLYAPAEWELTTIKMWIPHPHAFRGGYEDHRRWPDSMDEVRDAYAIYTLMEWIVRARSLADRCEEVANLEAWLIGTFSHAHRHL